MFICIKYNYMIFFIGFMGVGKSTIANELSEILDINVIDTDQEIENLENNSISNIFNKNGEFYFRKAESKLLRNLDSKKKKIIACGGGLPLFHDNMNYINEHGISIYLKADLNFIYNRLKKQKKKRPLIKNLTNTELKKFILNKSKEREKVYEKAKYIVNINNKEKKEILREISSLIFPL